MRRTTEKTEQREQRTDWRRSDKKINPMKDEHIHFVILEMRNGRKSCIINIFNGNCVSWNKYHKRQPKNITPLIYRFSVKINNLFNIHFEHSFIYLTAWKTFWWNVGLQRFLMPQCANFAMIVYLFVDENPQWILHIELVLKRHHLDITSKKDIPIIYDTGWN